MPGCAGEEVGHVQFGVEGVLVTVVLDDEGAGLRDAVAPEVALEVIETRHLGLVEDGALFLGQVEGGDHAEHDVGNADRAAVVPGQFGEIARIVDDAPDVGGEAIGMEVADGDELLFHGIPVEPGIFGHFDFVGKGQGNPVVCAADGEAFLDGYFGSFDALRPLETCEGVGHGADIGGGPD